MESMRESAGGIVLNARGEIALVENAYKFWGFPKGYIDPGEDALSAAKREIKEETGLRELQLVKELGSYKRPGGKDDSELKHISMFLFTTTEEQLAPEDPYNPEACWVAPDAVSAALTNEKDREFFERVREALTP